MQKIQPLKRLGQNFLVDKGVVRKIIKAADLQQSDIVLEIGPGLGVLTKELAKRVKKVIAVEKDPRMFQILKATFKDFHNIEIIQGDILRLNLQIQNSKFKIINYKVVANLPFYITAPTIRKFLESENPPKEMVLIVQKEVSQRICSKPPRMSILAVSIQFYARPEIIFYISKKSFWPQPKVDAAIIKISAFNQRRKSAFNQWFFRIVKAGFSHPRKQLANNLSKELKLNKKELSSSLMGCGIKPSQRAETLTINDWLKLINVVNPVRD